MPLPTPARVRALTVATAIAACTVSTACHREVDPDPTSTGTSPPLSENYGVEEDRGTEGCDNLLPDCLYPFPSAAYVDADGAVQLPTTPFHGDTVVDPVPMSHNVGFGAATPILFQLPSDVPVVLPAPGPFDSALSLDDGASTFVVDASTGERIPHWVESDYLSPNMDPPLIVIRPAIPCPAGPRSSSGCAA
ncbi:MAG: hypothetical protein R3F59_07215 [Myxococcota bacterium]